GRTVAIGLVDWGWENGFNRVGWERVVAELRNDPRLSRGLSYSWYVARLATSDGTCLARSDMIADSDWDRAWDFRNIVEPGGADPSLYCFRSIPGSRDVYASVIIARALGDRDFSARDKAVVREAMAMVAPLVGGPLARFADPLPTALSPLARRVLRCLLE